MALPTLWELLIPELSFLTIIGIGLILLGIFKNVVVEGIVWITEKLFGAEINNLVVRGFMVLGGITIVWLPSIIADYTKTTEGSLILMGIVFAIIVLAIILNKGKEQKVDF